MVFDLPRATVLFYNCGIVRTRSRSAAVVLGPHVQQVCHNATLSKQSVWTHSDVVVKPWDLNFIQFQHYSIVTLISSVWPVLPKWSIFRPTSPAEDLVHINHADCQPRW